MKKQLIRISLALMLVSGAGAGVVNAQSGGCSGSTTGEIVTSMANFGNATFGSAGDITVVAGGTPNTTDANTADMYLANASVTDVYAAMNIDANAMVWVDSGAILNIYGDFINNGSLVVAAGGTVNFYGNTWKNAGTAFVGDGINTNTIPGGAINFIAARPTISASFLTAGGCSMYSGGNFIQHIDGGNVPMDIALHIQNTNNIQLINTNTKIEGSVIFDVVDGDVDLGNHNFVFSANGNWSSNVSPNEAYFLTNGTSACAGAVEKLGLAPSATFTFPIGRAETYSGGRDYTPAMLRNDGVSADDFQVRVKNYADAISIGGVIISAPQEGIDRAWQITSTNGSGVTMSLQHNSATNGATYQSVFGSDPTAFITQYQGGGNWNVGPTPTNFSGTVSGSQVHARGFSLTTTATTCSDPNSWFTKTNDLNTPLPVKLLSFTGTAKDCDVSLKWETADEHNFNHFDVMYSDNATGFVKVGTIQSKHSGTSGTYTFTYRQPGGKGYYQLKMVDNNGTYTNSNTLTIATNCGDQRNITLSPNPTSNFIGIKGLHAGEQIQLYGMNGQLLINSIAKGSFENLDLSSYASGVYQVIIINQNERLMSMKVVKQ